MSTTWRAMSARPYDEDEEEDEEGGEDEDEEGGEDGAYREYGGGAFTAPPPPLQRVRSARLGSMGMGRARQGLTLVNFFSST